jgi:hypothetical protein
LLERRVAGRGGKIPRTLFIADKKQEESLCEKTR